MTPTILQGCACQYGHDVPCAPYTVTMPDGAVAVTCAGCHWSELAITGRVYYGHGAQDAARAAWERMHVTEVWKP